MHEVFPASTPSIGGTLCHSDGAANALDGLGNSFVKGNIDVNSTLSFEEEQQVNFHLFS